MPYPDNFKGTAYDNENEMNGDLLDALNSAEKKIADLETTLLIINDLGGDRGCEDKLEDIQYAITDAIDELDPRPFLEKNRTTDKNYSLKEG